MFKQRGALQQYHSHYYNLNYLLGWAPWNLTCFEFKFDNTRLSSYNRRIRLAQLKFLFDVSWRCGVSALLAVSPIQLGQSYSYIMRKVWYHQTWIQTYLGFIVLDLMYILLIVIPLFKCMYLFDALNVRHVKCEWQSTYRVYIKKYLA